jgi:hypothetical protein
MADERFTEGIRQYVLYLEQEIAEHEGNAGIESIAGSMAEEGHGRVLQRARDRLYEIFPEIRPTEYKTVAEIIKERDSQRS